jgi:hypothetical protein
LDIIKAFLEALKIKFEVKKDSPYDPEFVEKIEKDGKILKRAKALKFQWMS